MKEIIKEVVNCLKNGGIILYPTDTVWGLGCDATNSEAVAKIFEIKKREDSKSLVLLASDMDMVAKYVREIPEVAEQLVEVNDKPMTIVYPDALFSEKGKEHKSRLAYNVVAEDNSVGIRVPLMDFCKDICYVLGRPIVSTSANISGEPTPKSFSNISDDVKQAVDYIVDPSLEASSSGLASQIIKIGIDGQFTIIRK